MLLQGLTWQGIAARLANPSDPVTKTIVGDANYLTATICAAHGNGVRNFLRRDADATREAARTTLKLAGAPERLPVPLVRYLHDSAVYGW